MFVSLEGSIIWDSTASPNRFSFPSLMEMKVGIFHYFQFVGRRRREFKLWLASRITNSSINTDNQAKAELFILLTTEMNYIINIINSFHMLTNK